MNAPNEISENDALPLEYKRENGHPMRQADVRDFVGDTAIKRFLGSDISHVKKDAKEVT